MPAGDITYEVIQEAFRRTMSYDLNKDVTGSFAAAPRETQNKEIPKVMQKFLRSDEERQQKWYDSGKRAKQRGYGDFSPFYENATADYFFKCGYDNVPFVEAQQVLQTKIKDLLETSPEVKEVLNELQPQKS